MLVLAGFVWSGIYNIGADDAHSRPVYAVLQVMRDRSISARASKLHPPPNMNDAAMIKQGAGNYAAMCVGCHLAPGMAATELSKGLYPAPPALATVTVTDPAHHFWVTKHGIKASGMPAWGLSMSDEYIWGMVAFLQQLPKLDAKQYEALVASSSGHSHGGGETQSHHDSADPHAGMGMSPAAETPAVIEHRHADGTVESHPAPKSTNPAKADDGHDHEH
jgi:mono/diheme cytochrome c family protein